MFQMVLRLFQGASELPLPFFQHLTGTVPVLADFTLTHADYDVREVHEDIFPANAAWLWKWEAWSNEGKVTRLLEKAEGRAGVKIPRYKSIISLLSMAEGPGGRLTLADIPELVR